MLRNVAVAACDGVPAFELGVVCEVFGLDRTGDGLPGYDFAVCAVEPSPLRTSSGFSIGTEHGIDRLASADLIAVPGWRVGEPPPEALLEGLRVAVARGARVMSVCSGAFVLAATGLLDGRSATTHWRYAARLAAAHPRVRVLPDVLYIDEGSVLTSAGTAAGIDLCLHIVRHEHGAEVANAVARRMVVTPHREGGQAQYIEAAVAAGPGEDGVARALAWASRGLDSEITVGGMAAQARMSARTFARRFVATTGTTPHSWLLSQRIGLARRLLESSDLGVEQVASRSGFGSAAALRLQFSQRLATSPLAYRRAFRAGG